ncbi:hypothetical protein F4859DRAFT_518495 [Xylaria cf. heliscus]|nr:hypothetical protein F4859DRAFT_518495 [Xylaria cf. heliscus]
MLILAVSDLGDAVFRTARLFLVEQALYRTLYRANDPSFISPDGSIEEFRCKSDAYQADVTMVIGVYEVLMLLCGLVATPIYVRLIPTIGLRTSVLLNLSSLAVAVTYLTTICFFQFDIRCIWLTGFFSLVGGGQSVQKTLLYSYIAQMVLSDYL